VTRALTEVGFYGKLPCRGDFLQRRVPQDFVDIWDAWLQQWLHEIRERLQSAWLDSYLTGPVWRFALSSGVCGNGTYAGILVPSVDRVGRYFPLTVIAQLQSDDCPLAIACGSPCLFEAAESLVLEAIEAPALDFDTFDEQVALLRERLEFNSAATAGIPAGCRAMQPLALWWTQGSNAMTASWLCTHGLPDPRASVALLTGEGI